MGCTSIIQGLQGTVTQGPHLTAHWSHLVGLKGRGPGSPQTDWTKISGLPVGVEWHAELKLSLPRFPSRLGVCPVPSGQDRPNSLRAVKTPLGSGGTTYRLRYAHSL